jgi:predicted acylesterase/phospholipase RssA
MSNDSVALVLSAGGIRGASYIGAIEAMEEYGIIPDIVVGASSGAFFGSVYASGMDVKTMRKLAIQLARRGKRGFADVNYRGILQALIPRSRHHLSGLFKGDIIQRTAEENLMYIKTFGDYTALSREERRAKGIKDLYIVTVNLYDGKETVLCDTSNLQLNEIGEYNGIRCCNKMPLSQAIRHSFALPVIFTPSHCKPKYGADPCPCAMVRPQPDSLEYYIDGGSRDAYPIAVAAKIAKAKKVIGISLESTEPKPLLSLIPGNILHVAFRAIAIIGESQFEAACKKDEFTDASVLTINPLISNMSVFEVSMVEKLIKRGYEAVSYCFRSKGLVKGDTSGNLNRLFARSPGVKEVYYPPLDPLRYES